MSRKRRLFTIIMTAVMLTAPTVVSAEEADGGYAGAFLQVPLGARPAGMGGAYRSLANDGAGPLYNPAGIVTMKSSLFASSYRVMKLDRTLGYVTGLVPAAHGAIVGLNWVFASSGSVAGRNKDGDLTGDELTQNNHKIGFVFAKRFTDLWAAGAQMSYLHNGLGDLTTFGVGVDVGVTLFASQLFDRERQADMSIQDIQFSATVRNLGATYRWDTGDIPGSLGVIQDDKIPVEFGLAGSARFLQRKLILASDFVKNSEQSPRFYTGAEYYVYPEFAIRTGLSDGSFTAGTGYIIKLGNNFLAVDYAFTTDKVGEGSEHIFSFDLLF